MTEEKFIKKIWDLYITLKSEPIFEIRRDKIIDFAEKCEPFFKSLKDSSEDA